MNCSSSTPHKIIAGLCLFCLSAISPISAEAVDSAATNKPAPPTAAVAQNSAAAGAVEDSLRACMTRIPKDASLGQRLIAERSCARDDNDRKPFQDAPGR
jgi:hypothetical protein